MSSLSFVRWFLLSFKSCRSGVKFPQSTLSSQLLFKFLEKNNAFKIPFISINKTLEIYSNYSQHLKMSVIHEGVCTDPLDMITTEIKSM